ncbi:MaoC/PaaZ C-terminal domain-containing protein [Mesorhizobium sp. LHD-90]|uniref:MaoC family dehydratase n=1 Tax=Mesorhizobium sp. LHD-90 TaxID=3071414 RepID=UPI0027E0F9EB|nr:MaoC/PaaZ C-terminal domain-containing protein [Mesorhizobium sp. LHD-90]MDQ6432542.1 MaoC/PaaZ C-terminal domain-containing protein [Mesorhizobium sp. LHD-90]
MAQATIPLDFTYDTLKVGQKSVSIGRTVSDADHSLYMMLTGGWHPIHCDVEHAREAGLDGLLVQGTFGIALSLGSHLEAPLLRSADPLIGALGIKEWTYMGPIFVGDTLHIEVEIVEKKLTSDGKRYVVDRQITLINQKGKAVQKGVARSMWRRADV